MDNQQAQQLLNRYEQCLCTEQEKELLESWFILLKTEQAPHHLSEAELEEDFKEVWLSLKHEYLDQEPVEHIQHKPVVQRKPVIQPIPVIKYVPVELWYRIAAVASILLVIASGIFFYTSYYALHHPGADRNLALADNAIKPGGNKAILTLSDGSTITLNNAANGALAKQSGVQITKTANGQLIYEASSSNHPASLSPLGRGGEAGEGKDHSNNSSLPSGISPQRGERGVALNTIETPRGGQYQVRLPDGSKVWLNAASKLTYPVSFNGRKDRRVELSGEAYFEVAKDKQHPFLVKSNGQAVQVLGTHFNINSYADETFIKTTLLEGSVLVSLPSSLLSASSSLPTSSFPQSSWRGGTTKQPHTTKEVASSLRFPRNDGVNSIILKPGQQAILHATKIQVENADTEEAIAWQKGDFVFKEESLESIMRKIARWYDVEIIYAAGVPKNIKLGGFISRSKNISAVLKMIERTKSVKFKVEGKKITVLPMNK